MLDIIQREQRTPQGVEVLFHNRNLTELELFGKEKKASISVSKCLQQIETLPQKYLQL